MAPANTTAVARLATGNAIKIESVADLMAIANVLYLGGACNMPNVDRPEKVARIILAGMEVGLSPAQSLDSIWLGKNGKTSIWGDGALAIVRASGQMETFEEWVDGEGEDRAGHCKSKRANGQEIHSTFSIREANKAGLIERARGQKGDGPWITYQDRQLKMRARGFLLRDLYTDVMRGLVTTEELLDYPGETVEVEAKVISSQANTPQLPATAAAIGKPSPVTDDQKAKIKEIRKAMCVARSLKDPAEQQTAWVELLAGYGVTSANDFTAAQADTFIAAEWPKNDPFGQTATPSSVT